MRPERYSLSTAKYRGAFGPSAVVIWFLTVVVEDSDMKDVRKEHARSGLIRLLHLDVLVSSRQARLT